MTDRRDDRALACATALLGAFQLQRDMLDQAPYDSDMAVSELKRSIDIGIAAATRWRIDILARKKRVTFPLDGRNELPSNQR